MRIILTIKLEQLLLFSSGSAVRTSPAARSAKGTFPLRTPKLEKKIFLIIQLREIQNISK
jgi:hypothetical protein